MPNTTPPHPNKRRRNCLNFLQKYELARWLRKHLEWCKKQGISGQDMVDRAGKELSFPITVPNARNLWRELGNDWPFTLRGATNGKVSNASLAAGQKVLAQSIVGLYTLVGGEADDINRDILKMAGVASPDKEVPDADQG